MNENNNEMSLKDHLTSLKDFSEGKNWMTISIKQIMLSLVKVTLNLSERLSKLERKK